MEWTTSDGKTLELTDGKLHVVDPRSRPSTRTFDREDAFARPDLLFIPDLDVLVDVVVALAEALEDDASDDPIARGRQTFWRALDRGDLPTRAFSFVERHGDRETPCTLTIEGVVVTRESDDSMGYRRRMLLDEAFFYGPRAFGLSLEVRDALRSHVLACLPPSCGLTREDGFPDVDYAAVARRTWTHSERSDGESYVVVGGHTVTAGHQYQRDMGSSRYPVERVLTGAPGVNLGGPESLQQEVLEHLRAALR